MDKTNKDYDILICYKCDGCGYLKNENNKKCDICNGKGEIKIIKIKN